MKLPVVLFSTMPLVPPLAEMLVKLSVPPELAKLAAAPVVVVTLTSPVTRPVLPEAVMPVLVVLAIFSPLTWELVSIVTVFCSVGRVPPIEGLAMVPSGGVIPNTASKLAPLTP